MICEEFSGARTCRTSRIIFAVLNNDCSAQGRPREHKVAYLKLPGTKDSEH
jgi:hypothetical protein